MNANDNNRSKNMDAIEFAVTYSRSPWSFAGMNTSIRWTGRRYRIRSARGTVAYSADRNTLVALANSKGWNL